MTVPLTAPPIPDDVVEGDTPLPDDWNGILANLRANRGAAAPMPSIGHALWVWTSDVIECTTELTMTSGTLYMFRVYFAYSSLLTYSQFIVTSAGATPSTGSSLAVFTDSGTRVAVSGDIGSSFTATGSVVPSLGAGYAPMAGDFGWVGLLWRGTTSPKIAARAAAVNSTVANSATAASLRRVVTLASQTVMPSSVTLSSTTLASQVAFVGLL